MISRLLRHPQNVNEKQKKKKRGEFSSITQARFDYSARYAVCGMSLHVPLCSITKSLRYENYMLCGWAIKS